MQRLLSLLALLTVSASPALAGSPYDWRAYPNGAREVRVDLATEWLLLDARNLSIEGLEAALLKTLPTAVLVRIERLTADRVAVQVSGSDTEGLRRLGLTLVNHEVARRTWPAVTRETGVGFFDEQLVVAFDGPVNEALVTAAGAKLVGPSGVPGVYIARAHDGDGVGAAIKLQASPGVRYAEPDLIRHVTTLEGPVPAPADPEFAQQWHLENQSGPGSIRALEAWATTRGRPETVVAIFDTGFDMDHPDLVDNIVGGFDAAGGDEDPEAECGESYDGAGQAPTCTANRPFRESHGTAVAGVVAAVDENGIDGTGVCPDCSLYVVRLLGSSGLRSISNASAFRRAADEGAWVINNSWGPSLTRFFPLATSEREVFNAITTTGRDGKGVVLVFAAGNDYFTPATANPYTAHPGVMAVSASTQIDDFACYSNYGSVIAIAGPSQGCFGGEGGIATSDYVGGEGYSGTDFTDGFGGTSAASPVIAGVAGLILSANPELTAEQVRLVMQRTAVKIRADKNPWRQQLGVDLAVEFEYDANGFSQGFGYGRADAAAAVELAVAMPDNIAGLCDANCPRCIDNRCAPTCLEDSQCPGAARCIEGSDGERGCAVPHPATNAIGQPCSAECDFCVDALNSDLRSDRVCSAACEDDGGCPFGFDCRTVSFGNAKACVPGNAECGSAWGAERCQSDVRVSGGNAEFCSCDCIVGTAGACPDGFSCSNANCTQGRGGTLSCEATEGRGNYLPICFPDPGYKPPCSAHADCPGGLYCIDGTCGVDAAPEGCDVCAPCEADADCGPDSACVNVSRGKRCAPRCEGYDTPCPGDGQCTDLPGDAGFFCVNPDWQSKGYCPRSYRCEVADRCFLPTDCAEGIACTDNVCGDVVPVVPDAEVPADAAPADAAVPEADAGPVDEIPIAKTSEGCSQSEGSTPAGWALVLLGLALVRRRRLS